MGGSVDGHGDASHVGPVIVCFHAQPAARQASTELNEHSRTLQDSVVEFHWHVLSELQAWLEAYEQSACVHEVPLTRHSGSWKQPTRSPWWRYWHVRRHVR